MRLGLDVDQASALSLSIKDLPSFNETVDPHQTGSRLSGLTGGEHVRGTAP
jgi:hypothetical protein